MISEISVRDANGKEVGFFMVLTRTIRKIDLKELVSVSATSTNGILLEMRCKRGEESVSIVNLLKSSIFKAKDKVYFFGFIHNCPICHGRCIPEAVVQSVSENVREENQICEIEWRHCTIIREKIEAKNLISVEHADRAFKHLFED